MPTQCISDQLEFEGFMGRRVVASSEGGAITSAAGALLLREADQAIGLIDQVTACFEGHRHPDAVVYAAWSGRGSLALPAAARISMTTISFALIRCCFFGARKANRKSCAALAGKSAVNWLEHAPGGGEERYHKISHDAQALPSCVSSS